MYNEKICQRLRANSVVSAWENQRLLRCEKWPRKEKTCRRTKCWNKATNDSNQLRRARMWTFRFPRLIEAVWTHPTSQMLFKSTISETGLYTLGTKAGTLNTQFSRNQFNVIQRNLFPFYRVSSFIGSQKLVSAYWGSKRLVPTITPNHQHCKLHLYHQHEQHDGKQWAPAWLWD